VKNNNLRNGETTCLSEAENMNAPTMGDRKSKKNLKVRIEKSSVETRSP
jgi:hypothetical protein